MFNTRQLLTRNNNFIILETDINELIKQYSYYLFYVKIENNC